MGNTKLKCEDYKHCNIKDKDGYCANNERSCIWREGAVDTDDRQLTIPVVIKSACKHPIEYQCKDDKGFEACSLCGERL